ncbi:MAG TPA: hypothetical protein VEO56_06325, partial [Bacteroidota bacterium]|nr:hypothetical protein [Bacteroidota bacterium]
MKYQRIIIACLVIVAGTLIAVLIRLSALFSEVESEVGGFRSSIASLRDTIAQDRQHISKLEDQLPGLGEYMTTIQLHAAKLSYAAGASNWPLASYELDELKETFEAVDSLHLQKNGVRLSGVIESLLNTQLPPLREAITEKSRSAFTRAYGETLLACNGCHRPAGYPFIVIRPPHAEPVSNQQWIPQ